MRSRGESDDWIEMREWTSTRRWWAAIALATVLHAVALWLIRFPTAEPPPGGAGEIDLVLPVPMTQPRIAPPPSPPDAAPAPSPTAPQRLPRAAMSPYAPLDRTIPPNTLRSLGEATAALEPGVVGITRKRAEIDPDRLATARAESLLDARLATLPGAARSPRRPFGLGSGGGVTIGVPWPGFLPANLSDEGWREERCRGEDAGDSDKAGERAGRDAQCAD